MKPPPFDYVAAGTIDQAVDLLNGEADARVIAGGQSLMPLLNLRMAAPELIVDIGRIDALHSITVADDGLTIGAAVTQASAAEDPRIIENWPVLAEAIGLIGHPQIRNRGTVCGSLAHNDPLAELPAVALALDAVLTVIGPSGERRVAAAELFSGPFMTTLDAGELVTAASFARLTEGTGWSIREFATRTGDFATAGVVTMLRIADNIVRDARVVLFGLGSHAHRSAVLEAALAGATTPTLSDETLAAFDESIDPTDDAHASAAARRELAADLVTTSIAEAWERAR